MVCTKLDSGYCKVIAAPCPKRYEVKMVTYRKCPNFGKAAVKISAKAKVKAARKSAARKVKRKSVSKARRRR
jgi:hypothetical protein